MRLSHWVVIQALGRRYLLSVAGVVWHGSTCRRYLSVGESARVDGEEEAPKPRARVSRIRLRVEDGALGGGMSSMA